MKVRLVGHSLYLIFRSFQLQGDFGNLVNQSLRHD